jgi:hypothetical protein
MTPSISGAGLASAYNAGLTPDQAADEQAAAARQATQQGAPPAAQPAVAAVVDPWSSALPQDAASFNLDTLAAAVGLDPDELLNQVKSGQGVSGLLGRTGATGYGSTIRDSVRGGIVFDEYV